MITAKISTRHLVGRGGEVRCITPSGVMATRRRVIRDEASASTATPAITAIRANEPTHSSSKVKCLFWKLSSMIDGITAT